MSTRSILALSLATGLVAGCGAPYHEEVRIDAQRRLNVVNARLAYDQAEQAFETGQFDKARDLVERAIARDPESASYHLLHGRVLLETHQLEKALESLRTALERDPGLAKAHYFAGIVFQRWSDDDRAHQEYLAASELEPTQVAYLLAAAETQVSLGNLEEARAMIEPKLDYFEHNAAMRHLLGEIALLEDDALAAADYLEEAWFFNPDDDLLLEQLANAQYEAGLYEKCYRSIRHLKELRGSKDPELLHFEARCLTHMERLQEARGIYSELTGLKATDPEIWVDFGVLAWELADFHRVALCGARLTVLAPERYEGYLLKGINEHHHGNLSEARSLLEDALDRDGQAPMVWMMMGRVLQDAGDREGAREAYGQVVRLDPDNAAARALLADLSREDEKIATGGPSDQPR